MEYSKISSVELINFMSFKQARIEFDESGIVNIKGYNDSGKSAILRGLAVCLMDMFKRSQTKFIRHGEQYFRVVVTFEDGISILKDKYENGQSLYEMYKGDELIFTTKQGNKLSKVDGVPEPIEVYLGLCVTDSVYLNYQSCLDRLPIVDTKGSENYQMLHEALRTEEIYRANNMINTDKNELGARISEIEYDIQSTEVLLEKCGDVTQEFIDTLKDLEKEAILNDSKKKALYSIDEILKKYNSIPNLPEIPVVSGKRLASLEIIQSLVLSLDGMVVPPDVPKVSVERLSLLQGIQSVLKNIESFVSLPDVEKVDTSLVDRMSRLSKIQEYLKGYYSQYKKYTDVKSSLKDIKAELDTLMQSAKSKGIDFVKCDNCGSYTIVGGGHKHE